MVLGIDFSDGYIAVKVQGEENASVFPAVICRDKNEETWYIGEDAYRTALEEQGVMTDRLLKLLARDGVSTVYQRTYSAVELVTELFRLVMRSALKGAGLSAVEQVCLAVHAPDASLMDKASACLELAGIPGERQTVITHEEAFVHYTLAREKEFASAAVALFDLSAENFSYYEFRMIRGVSRRACMAESEDLEESFHADILKKESGQQLGDKIITDVAEKHMNGKIFSAVLLTGTGFDRTDWAQSFLSYVCQRRRVVQESGLFAVGAALAAEKLQAGKKEECLVFCNSRISSELSVPVCVREKESRLVLVPAGERWHGLKLSVELIPKGQNRVDLTIESFDTGKPKQNLQASLEGFPERPDRTTRIALEVSFRSRDTADLTIRDLGFGELFPASGRSISEEIRL